MKNYRQILEASARRKDKELEKARKSAERWSLDDKNNIGQAIVTFLGGKYVVSADASDGVEVFAKFVDGKEVSIKN